MVQSTCHIVLLVAFSVAMHAGALSYHDKNATANTNGRWLKASGAAHAGAALAARTPAPVNKTANTSNIMQDLAKIWATAGQRAWAAAMAFVNSDSLEEAKEAMVLAQKESSNSKTLVEPMTQVKQTVLVQSPAQKQQKASPKLQHARQTVLGIGLQMSADVVALHASSMAVIRSGEKKA